MFSCETLFTSGVHDMSQELILFFYSLMFVECWHLYILHMVPWACLKIYVCTKGARLAVLNDSHSCEICKLPNVLYFNIRPSNLVYFALISKESLHAVSL